MPATTIYFEPTKRQHRAQVLNDALPGIILLFTGLGILLNEGFISKIMPYVDVLVGVVVIRTAITELRQHKNRNIINWFDISAGCVILIEAADMYKSHKGFQPAHILYLIGVLTIVRGILAERLPKMKQVVLSEEKMYARTSLFRVVSCSWKDLSQIEIKKSAIVFTERDQKKQFGLRRIGNRDEVVSRIIEHAKVFGIPVEDIVENKN